MKKKIFYILLLLSGLIFSQNLPPSISVVGNQNYCADTPMPIVTAVEITDPDSEDNTLDVVYIQISEGYSQGQDILTLSGNHPNISDTWNSNEGQLILSGPATFDEFTLAIASVQYQTTQTNFSEDKYFSINLGNANYLPSTGHYYFYVSNPGITWTDAKNAAESIDYFGLQGYLATLTTQEEAQLAGEQSPGTGWIGANDVDIEGVWKWVTGPESGTVFWIGAMNGSPQNGEFSYWNSGEPNNCCGGEDYAHITDPSIGFPGAWNDLPNTGDVNVTSPYHPQGFVVEFGGMPGDPEINISGSTNIVTPRLSTNDTNVCGEGVHEIIINTNTDEVLWFESNISNTSFHSGFTYSTNYTTTTTYWLMPLFSGCTSGPKYPVTVNVLPLPAAENINIIQCDDENQDGITYFNINNYFDVITGGIITNRVINYFEDINLTIEINGDAYTNLYNSQTVYALVTDTNSGCTNVSEVVLNVSPSLSSTAYLEVCDDTNEDGLALFDLSDANSQILQGLPSTYDINYYPSFNDALLETNILSVNYTNEEPYNQTIYARVQNGNECYGISEVVLNVLMLPNLEPDEEVFYCLNEFPETITLFGGVINDVPNNYYYNWSTGETTITIDVNQPGNYTVTVTHINGCSKTRTITVTASNIATIENIIIDDITNENSVTVIVSGEGNYDFSLDNPNGPYQNSNTFLNVDAGLHTVYIRDYKNNCGIVSKAVSVIGYPKYFTPNNDGYNDTWKIKGISNEFQPQTKVFIFNRYGKLLFIMTQPDHAWDGTYNGYKMPSDDYWFEVQLEDGRTFKGHFTLKN